MTRIMRREQRKTWRGLCCLFLMGVLVLLAGEWGILPVMTDRAFFGSASAQTTPPDASSLEAWSGLADLLPDQISLIIRDGKTSRSTGYKIERKTGASGTWSQIAIAGPPRFVGNITLGYYYVGSYTDSGLSPNTTYYYRVRGYNAAGDSPYSNEQHLTIPAPSALTAAAVSTAQIDLSWQAAPSGQTGFKIERRTGATGGWGQIGTLGAATTYSSTGLRPNTFYSYRVRAYYSWGDSPYSNEASATTLPAAPSALTATARSSGQIDLSWRPDAGGQTGFKIERRTGATGAWSQIAAVGAASTHSSAGLSPNTSYSYRVRAYNSGGDSPYSNEAGDTTLPVAPSNLTATAASPNQVDLSWRPNPGGQTVFKIERRTPASGAWSEVATLGPNATTYTSTGLSANTTYSYRVRASNSGGDSPYSNEASARTAPPAAPSTLTAIPASSSEMRLTWQDNATDETGFKIERRTAATGSWSQIATVGPSNSGYHGYLNSGLSPNTTFSYRVRAYNAVGDSPYSNEASGTTVASAPPAAPSNLSPSLAFPNRIDLSWRDNSTDRTGFKIERRTGPSGNWSQIATVGASVTTYSYSGLSPGTAYSYRVRAYNSAGDSRYSNEASVFTVTPPRAPCDLRAFPVSSRQITLKWQWRDCSENAMWFSIERKAGATGSWNEVGRGPGRTETGTDSGLSPNTTYSYRLRGYNLGGYSPYSNEASATTFRQ